MTVRGADPTPAWRLNELGSVGRENLDPGHVRRYDAKEDADAAGELDAVRAAGVAPEATVVDVGAGTGQFALAAAVEFRRVVAVDPSPVMLDLLRRKAAERSSPLEIVRAGFLGYRHQGEPADLLYSRYALHHLPDFWKAVALTRLRGMLRPGGIFRLWDVVYDFPASEAERRIEQWCATLPVSGDGWTRGDVEEHVRDEHSTFSWLLEPMIERAGFEIRDATYSDDRFSAMYVLVA